VNETPTEATLRLKITICLSTTLRSDDAESKSVRYRKISWTPAKDNTEVIKKMISKIARARTFVAMLLGLDIQTPWESVPVIDTANVQKYPDVDSAKISHREARPTSTRPLGKKPAVAPANDRAASQRAAG